MPATRRPAALLALLSAAVVALAGCSATVDGTGTGPTGSASAPSTGSTGGTGSPDVPSSEPVPTDSAGSSGSGTQDETDYFSVTLPSGWTSSPSTQSAIVAIYFGPRVDGFTVNVNVARENAQGATLDAYRARTLSNLQTKLPIKDLSETSSLTVDGEDAVAYDFRSSIGSIEARQGQVIVLHDGYGYVITYSATAANFEQYSDAAQSIVTSLRWR